MSDNQNQEVAAAPWRGIDRYTSIVDAHSPWKLQQATAWSMQDPGMRMRKSVTGEVAGPGWEGEVLLQLPVV